MVQPFQGMSEMNLRFGKLSQSTVLVALSVVVTVLVVDWFCIELTRHSGRIAAIWLANGFVVVVLLRSATPTWRLVLAAAYVANLAADLLTGDAFLHAMMLSLANAIEAFLVAYPLRFFELGHDIRSVRSVAAFLLLVLGPAVFASALLAAFVLSTLDSPGFWSNFLGWYASDVLGLVLVVPVGAYTRGQEFRNLFNAENRNRTFAALALILVALSIVLSLQHLPMKYLLVPAVLYLTFQSDYAGAVLGMTLVGAVMLTALYCGVDVVSTGQTSARGSVLWLQVFLVVLNITALTASAQLRQRRLLEQKLKTSMREALAAREAAIVAQQTAESASRAKSQFLSNMSHELRTPLNAILGFSSLMRNGDLSMARCSEYAGDIHEAGSHLLDLITDVLDISKIEAGKRELQMVSLDLCEPVGEAVTMARKLSDAKGITLTTELPNHNMDIIADRRAIKQITLNILSNAVKFTDEGGRISVLLDETPEGALLKVKDTGIGIPAEFLPRLGIPFEQVHGNNDRQYQGTGLGLALVKSLTQLHGGTVSIDSTERVGTTVSVYFPRTNSGRCVA